ncbi:hypothetical protein [Segniliparus rotundus]|nr:hypothetical protein [Segniliparus rotundus]
MVKKTESIPLTALQLAIVRETRAELTRQGLRVSALQGPPSLEGGTFGAERYVRARLGEKPAIPLTLLELEIVCRRLGLKVSDLVERAELSLAAGRIPAPLWPEERPERQPHWGGPNRPERAETPTNPEK